MISQGQPPHPRRQRLLLTLLAQQKLTRGFTLVELLIVMLIIAALFAIAAPGWFSFMNRQRVSGAKTEVLQVLREAQKLAITRRGTYSVQISDAAPEVSIFSGDGTGDATLLKTYNVGKQDGSEANVALTTLPAAAGNTVVFSFDGTVKGLGTLAAPVQSNSDGSLYKVVVSPETGTNLRSCVVIDTLLGSMSEGSGNDCDA